MADDRRFVRLPNLPSWEKLLARLYVLPDSAIDKPSLRLELIGLATKESLSLTSLFSQLCAFLPRLTGCEGVVIWSSQNNESPIVASNLSLKKSAALISHRQVSRLAKDNHYYFNRQCPPNLTVSGRAMAYCQLLSLGRYDNQSYFLVAASSRPISSETARMFEIIRQVLRLRVSSFDLAKRLEVQELKLANLTQQLGEGMAVLDKDLRVTLWNRALQRLTGHKTAQVLGQRIEQVWSQITPSDWLSTMLKQAEGRDDAHVSADFEILAPGLPARWINCLLTVYKDNAGQLEQVVIVARDISLHKSLEVQKNEFISIATHELRTPLTAIRGYLNLLERDNANFTDKQRSYMAQAIKASNRLAALTEDLLKVVQIEQDRIQFKPQNFRVSPLLKKVVRDFKPRATSKGLSLSLSGPHGNDQVRADPERTEQIFANLIDNAIKYTNQGSVKVSVEPAPTNGNRSSLSVSVRDSGIGIDLRDVNEVFEKFHRAHRPEQSREQGAGLGLYIVKSFVEKQSGTITVKSRAGKGTIFTVTLPSATTSQRSKNG